MRPRTTSLAMALLSVFIGSVSGQQAASDAKSGFPRGHHSLLLAVTGTPSEFTTMRGISQLVPGYWEVLTGWLGRASRARPSRD